MRNQAQRIPYEQLVDLLDRLAYPDRYPDSGSKHWHSGDGPFEEYAEEIAMAYRALVEKEST